MTFDVPNCPLSLGDTVVYMEHIQNVHVFTTGFQQSLQYICLSLYKPMDSVAPTPKMEHTFLGRNYHTLMHSIIFLCTCTPS